MNGGLYPCFYSNWPPKECIEKTNHLVYHWLCIKLHFNLNRRSYHLIWVYPKHEFFMLLGNHFLCFQHFSLSLFFFPKCRNWGAHYTRVHTVWYINAGLLEKEKQVISGINSLRHCEKQNTLVLLLSDEHFFFLFIRKELEKFYLYCLRVPNYLLL